MDLKQIKELITVMERAGIKRLVIKQKGGDELHLEREDEHPPHAAAPVAAFYPPISHPPAKEHPPATPHKPHPEEQPGQYVVAPLVGTYYASPSPEDPPFVKVGDRVDENTIVCIIEAMKVMNEVKAGVSGTVAEVLVDNAHPVEFGTKMIRIV